MNVENFTPFTPATFVSGKESAGYTTTVLVKAAFAMRHGKVAKPLDAQLFPCGDTYHEGADPATSSLMYASDFVPPKPRADVLLAATAYRPADQPTGTFRVGVRVGSLIKQLAVSGRREFAGILSSSIVEREPLATIPITYENAFGGPKNGKNPVGRGHKSNELPSIEYLDQRLRLPGDNIPSAGFGAIAPNWEPRKSMIGTFGPDYLEKHWPGFPGDFDQRFFNAAPADQQVAGYLSGDEEIVLENLHPERPMFATRLPGWRVLCIRENENGNCELIPLVIDTLWIHPDANQLVLVWRGRITVETPDALEIKRLGFLVEGLAAERSEAAVYGKRLQDLIDERDKEFQPELPPAKPTQEAVAPEKAEQSSDDIELRAVEAAIATIRTKAGLSPQEQEVTPTEPQPLSPEAQARYDEIMAAIEAEDRRQAEEDAARKWTREKVIAAVKAKQSLVDADLSGLDLHDCDFIEADFRGAKLDGVNFFGSILARAMLTGCSLAQAKLDMAWLNEANLEGANLRGASAARASLVAAKLERADLSNAVLDGANLSAATAQKAIFHGTSFVAANISKANLTRSVLSRAKGPLANFEAAILIGAACDHAEFSEAIFKKADLTQADFTASKLNHADLRGARAVDADFTQAELRNASFRRANCEGMWLSSACADGADFQEASCVDLQLDGTSAKQANFTGCHITSFRGSRRANLTGAIFQHTYGTEPIFETCRLHGADFSHAHLPGANFVHASATESNFVAADLTGARFDHANCQNATFVTANLFQAIFSGANLIGADISEGNCYGAEFFDARVSKLRFKNCNLQMTKLES